MRKRVICKALALAMAALVAVPQAGVTTMAATKTTSRQEVKASAKEEEAKTGDQITKTETKTNWKGEIEGIVFSEIEHYGDYENAINEISVNGKVYVADWNDDDQSIVYTTGYLGMQLALGGFKDGDNKIVIKATGYKDKTIIVNKSGDTYTFVSQTDGDSTAEPDPTPTPTPSIQDPKEDGVYTVAFKATKEGSEEESTLGSYFEGKAKLKVENGEMKLSMLNVSLARYLLDFTLETDGKFATATKEGYGDASSEGGYDAYEYTMSIKDLNKTHKAAALVSVMGSASDKGNYDKYMKADITFTSVEKGWKGYEKKDAKQTLIDALVKAGCDTNNDGEISQEELAAFDGDEGSLDLSNCGLSDISLLKGLSDKITSIDLSENKITEIPEGLFDQMTNLKNVYLNSNHIKSISENTFKNTKNLEWINLRANNLTEIKKNTFAGLSKLKYLELDNNNIASIENGAFDGDTSLGQLSISGNELSTLPEHLLDSAANSLEFMNISSNEFAKLPNCMNVTMEKLRGLIAYNNVLTDISNIDFSKMENLTQVDFMKNYIEKVADGTFANNKKLYSVDFHDNQISSMTAKAFADTLDNGEKDGVLRKLDVTLNNMKVVDPALIKKSDQAYNKFYPQKTAMNLQLKKDGENKISWNQDLSVLDLVFWFDKTAPDEARELETIDDYKDMLDRNGWLDKNIADVMSENYEWNITTEIQKKNADGTWETVKEDTTDKAESLTGSYDVTDEGTYRIVKAVSTTLNGTMQYRLTVRSNELNLSKQNTTEKPNTPTTEKPSTPTTEAPNTPTTEKPSTTTEVPTTTTVVKKVTQAVKTKLSKVTNLKVKNKKKRKAVITWKKVKNASGYQIYRATKKNGKFRKVKTVKGNSVVKYTNKKLNKNKKYYYKVRAYRVVKGKIVYGAFSGKKSVSIKK